MSDPDQSRSSNKKQNDQEKLWNDLEIDFRLEAFKFPDNKIYGIVKIIPESSRKLIKKFILVVNDTTRIDFNVSYDTIAASGFNTDKKDPSVCIEAISDITNWLKPKSSKKCFFHFIDDVFALSPTISFEWPETGENAKANLIVKWFHLGDKIAQKYIMYLDGVDIQYIHQKQIEDVFCVSIESFDSGKNHTFQLVAKLINGKETYRSDLMEFTVPKKDSSKNQETEFITVTNELPPPNLPIVLPTKDDIISDAVDNNKEQSRKPSPVLKEPLKNNNIIYTCCNDLPHKEFPGIEHYLKNISHIIPTSPKSLINGSKNSTSCKEKTNDDDDVVVLS